MFKQLIERFGRWRAHRDKPPRPARLSTLNARRYVAASRAAALFEKHPYLTHWMLWQYHRNGLRLDADDVERIRWGRRFQTPILEGIAEDFHLDIYPRDDVILTDPKGSPLLARHDADIYDPARGRGTVEVACVDYQQFKEHWSEENDIGPIHKELQLQVGMMCSKSKWGLLVAMVNGNHAVLFHRVPNPALWAELRAKASEFMATVDAGEEPDPFGAKPELAILDQLYPTIEPEKVLDLTGEQRELDVAEDIKLYDEAARKRREADKDIDAHKVALRHVARDAEILYAGGWRLKITKSRNGALRFYPKEL